MPILHFANGDPCECERITSYVTDIGYLRETAYPCLRERSARMLGTQLIDITGVNAKGNRNGPRFVYSIKGKLQYVDQYMDGQKIGICKFYNDTGYLVDEILLACGQQIFRCSLRGYQQPRAGSLFPAENFV